MKRFFRKLLSVFGPAVVSALGFSGCDIIPIGRAEYGSPSADFKVDISVTDESGNPLKDIKVTPVLLYTSVNKNYMGQDLPPKTIREELPALSTDEAGKALNMYSLTSVSKDVRLIFEDVDGELNGGSFAKDSVDLAVVKSKNGDNNWYSGEWTVSGKMNLNKE
ncbi:MAG: radical SAM-associated putative lipoprotein [Bacteroidales bacterium]|nr:radical SAM-associated putative lipoprotein [Bacteroidales bacterium]